MAQSPFLLVAGARPNFMKVAPIARVFRKKGIAHRFLHTGQHHDAALSDVFLKQLGLGRPDYHLGVGSGSHIQTVARIMERCEPILIQLKPRAVIVVGDVNSTLALTLAASKLNIPVVHVEAGLRSRDRMMPEEVNRILTDVVSDLLLTPSSDADENLKKEGITKDRIVCVGNVMIDSLRVALTAAGTRPATRLRLKASARQAMVVARVPASENSKCALMTFHRPSNVDTKVGLQRLLRFLQGAAKIIPVHLPLHPRTRAQLQKHGLWKAFFKIPGLQILDPVGYFEFVAKMRAASVVVTDSGGIQEETTYLGVPCLIMRTTTERPVCVTRGTAELMGENYDAALRRMKKILSGKWKKPKKIPLWDGRTAERIVSVLTKKF